MRLRYFAALILTCGFCTLLRAQRPDPSPNLEIHFIDVGQGDAVLLKLGRQAILVDAGRGDDIILVLAEQGVDSLVAAIASHNHQDHIGGMDAVLADIPTRQYLYNGRQPESDNAASVMDWLAEREIPTPAAPWPPIELGDVRVSVFPSPLDPDRVGENNSSLGVLVERGTFKALLTGDSEVEELNAWMKAGVIPRVDLLKAAHHGARNGVTPGWLLATRPDVVVISVGANNSYGHPDPWAMRYYQAGHRKVYRTDLDGSVIVLVDKPGGYRIVTTGPTSR